MVVENEERGNGFTIFKWFTENEYHRERKSVFLPTSINQFQGIDIIVVENEKGNKPLSQN